MKFTTRKGVLIAWLKRKNDHFLIVDIDGDELLKVDMPPECSTFANNDFRVNYIFTLFFFSSFVEIRIFMSLLMI